MRLSNCRFERRKRDPWPEKGLPEYEIRLRAELEETARSANERSVSENPICKKCGDNGIVFSVVPDEFISWKIVAAVCPCRKFRTPDFKVLSDFKTGGENWRETVKEAAQRYIDQGKVGEWFFMGGQVGSGKSFICSVIARALHNKGLGVKEVNWPEMSRQLKNSVLDWDYEKLAGAYKRAPVLVIDDFFLGKPTDADVRLAREILDYRYENTLRTIINSEKLLREIRRDVDEGAASRISEKAKGYILNIERDESRDYRRRK